MTTRRAVPVIRRGAHSRRDGAQPALGAARGANSCSVSDWPAEGRRSGFECQARRAEYLELKCSVRKILRRYARVSG